MPQERRISKPSRYLGNEWNGVRKDWSKTPLRLALLFPEPYEIGMSHYGVKVIYHLANARPDTLCERFFLPWPDKEAFLREQNLPLVSQESARPLADFSLVGVSLQYEMSYTNLLTMLELSKFPFLAQKRDGALPPLIGGGPCTFNPEPLAEILDAFLIGEGEEAIEDLLNISRELHLPPAKKVWLDKLASVPGFYVPGLYEVKENNEGRVQSRRATPPAPERVSKRLLADFSLAAPPPCQPVPFMRVVHDRLTVEIQRGCVRGCRFCQAGMIYRPSRQADPQRLAAQTAALLKRTGYEEVGFLSLNSNDYRRLPELIGEIRRQTGEFYFDVSLPSQRMDNLPGALADTLAAAGRGGITFAPEAGSQRLRDAINKQLTEEEILEGARTVFQRGWKLLKLYFMIGLPGETEEDILAIAGLLQRLYSLGRELTGGCQLHVAINGFVPKPHTPFQWERQCPPEELVAKFELLIKNLHLPKKQVVVRFNPPELSLLEGIFARGGRLAGRLLLAAYRRGARMDGWGDHFQPQLWRAALAEIGPTPEQALRQRPADELLPWDFIDSGISRDYLLSERDKARRAETTPCCLDGGCSHCGVCRGPVNNLHYPPRVYTPPLLRPAVPGGKRRRLLFCYSKNGEAAPLSHLETMQVLLRALRRANIPVCYSQGAHPAPKIAMDRALQSELPSDAEYFSIQSEAAEEVGLLARRLDQVLPDGLRIKGGWVMGEKDPAVDRWPHCVLYQARCPELALDQEAVRERLAAFEKASSWPLEVERKPGKKVFELKERVRRLTFDPLSATFELWLDETPQAGPRPLEALPAILRLPQPLPWELYKRENRLTFPGQT